MALKTKEKLDEDVKKVAKAKNVKTKTDVKKEPKKAVTKTVKKASSTKKLATKKDENKKTKKVVKELENKVSAKKATKNTVKKVTNKKAVENEKIKKETKPKKESKSSKSSTKKVSNRKTLSKRNNKKSQSKVLSMNTLEYYDLPYRYNQTLVKVLAQNPNTLFVYWDISDEDILNFEKKYGKEFFYKTRPVLIVHNVTKNYSFEIDINDFANNWYVNVEDTKCKYLVELGRRSNYYESQAVSFDYLNIAFSNTIEIPNDKILFFKENDRIYFKNIKTNKITEKVFKNDSFAKNVNALYKNYNLSKRKNKFDFNNPSSQNPSSTLL